MAAHLPYGGDLYGATGTAANDVWAVGANNVATAGNQGTVEHFDGAMWRILGAPSYGSTQFLGAAVTNGHLWVAARSTTAGGLVLDRACRM